MAHIKANRIGELSTIEGFGPVSMTSAVAMRRFGSVMSNGDTCWYLIVAVNASTGALTGEYEFGKGTYLGANVLDRTTPRGSSNSDGLVNFAPGVKQVTMTILAPDLLTRDDWLKALGLDALQDVDPEPVASASHVTVPSASGVSAQPVPLMRYLRPFPSTIDYSGTRNDDNVFDVQDRPLSVDFATLAEAREIFPFATDLADQRDWAELQAAAYAGADASQPFNAEGRWLNVNRTVYCSAEFTRFLNKRCRIHTGLMAKRAIENGDAPAADLTFPDAGTDYLGVVSGAVFAFTDFAIEPVLEGIEFDGARFPIVFLAGALNPVLRNIRGHRSNCMVFCYSGDLVNPTFENCGGDELGTLLISSATAFPSGHPESGTATNATYGLTAIASEFTPKVYADFNTWFRNSIMRPAASSVTSNGVTVYGGTDLAATGKKAFIPRRNTQAQRLTWAAISGGRVLSNCFVRFAADAAIDWDENTEATVFGGGGGGTDPEPSQKTAYLLAMTDAELGSNPAKWGNQVVNGGTFSNLSNGGSLGGQSGTGAPFGRGMWAQPAAEDGLPVAVISDQVYTGLRTIELHVINLEASSGEGDRSLTRWYINATDYLDFLVRAGGTGYYIDLMLKQGSTLTSLFATPDVAPIAVAGKDAAYHFAPQHEDDGSVTLRGNGALLGTSTVKFLSPFVGHVDPYGAYDRTNQIATGMFHAETSNLRGSYVLRYFGETYEVPTERFALD